MKTLILIFVLVAASAVGCTNRKARLTASIKASSTVTSYGDSGISSSSFLTLAKVLKNPTDPSTTFDLIGDGTGLLGQYCVSTGNDQQSPNSGPSTCTCSFSYIRADGSSESFETPTTYQEANLIRCLYTGVPPSVPYVKVKIHLTNADVYSNEVTYKTNGSGLSLDLSDPNSYARVQRYQCRDVVTIGYLLDPSRIYDPIQSEDPRLTFPSNFYATNMGAAISTFAATQPDLAKYWNCPPVPNDTAAGLDLTVYSVAADSSGSKLIYPPAGSAFDRSTFFLARSPVGVFSIPLNAYVAPTNVSSENGAIPPIGFAAPTIPVGAGKETCPDSSVTIPSGYHWVKVWPFRADLAPRKFRSSPAIQKLGSVSCNPGTYSGGQAVFTNCSPNARAKNNAGFFAARVLGTGMCVHLDTRGGIAPLAPFSNFSPCGRGYGAGCTTRANGTQFGGYDLFAPGTDIWEQANGTASISCPNAANGDPMNLCNNAAPVGGRVPYDANPMLQDLDAGLARFDFLFVATPPTVMLADMVNQSSSLSLAYTPFRFTAPGDCNSPDPDSPLAPGDCSPSRKIGYGLKLHDISTNGDPPGNDPNRPGVFPVCALQPN